MTDPARKLHSKIGTAERLAANLKQHQNGEDPTLGEVLSRAHVGILQRDLNRRVITVNDRFCELVGRSAAELEGMPFEAFTHPDDVAATSEAFRRHLVSGEPLEIENRYLRPDGSVSWCIVHISFLRDENGAINSTIAVAVDVTDRRDAQDELRESDEHYRYTIELSSQVAWTASPDGQIEDVSSRWTEITGMRRDEALGGGWAAALKDEDVGPTMKAWAEALESKRPVDVEYRLRAPGGTYRWFRARAVARLDEAGEVVRWYGTLEDVDDRRAAEERLRISEERFRLAAQAAGLGIVDYDARTGRAEWSDEVKAMLGFPPDTVPDVAIAMGVVIPKDRPKLAGVISAVGAGDLDPNFDLTLRIRRADNGAERIIQTGGWRSQAPSGRLERVLVTIRDVTEERTAEERIRWAANHDALTGMPNRTFFSERLEEAIATAAARGEKLALALFDVDYLKETNDTIGHHAGDLLLRVFAERLKDGLIGHACLARIGGDEFAAFLPVEDEAETIDAIYSALRELRAPFAHEEQTLDCQATAGVSIFPNDGQSAVDLLRAADIALYAGKAGQRGSLTVFKPDLRAELQRRASMLGVARSIVRDDRIVPFYQPKVVLADRRVIGFEALLRWQHNLLGIQEPGTIAAAFEDMTIASDIGERMLSGVCADLRDWLDRGIDVGSVAINLSPAEFRREDLFDRFMHTLRQHQIPSEMIELEVTETVFLGHGAEAVGQTLNSFHREGLRIALDDFGTGYASLTHLQAFPVDAIKIDRSFVANVAARSGDAAIVDAIIGLARRLGMDVIAEGIEQVEQESYLIEQGCRFGQGFLYSRAVPAKDVDALIARSQAPREDAIAL